MYLALNISILAITILTLIGLITVKVRLVFNSEKSELNMTILWIKPLIKAFIKLEETKPFLSLYLFNKIFFKKSLQGFSDKQKGRQLLEITSPKDVQLNIEYGFKDPFTTGIACGVINVASQFANVKSLKHTPDFISVKDYVYLDANAKVNLGSSLIKFLKFKSRH